MKELVRDNELSRSLPGKLIAAWAYEIDNATATVATPPAGLMTPHTTPSSSDYVPRRREAQKPTFISIPVRPEVYSRVISFVASLEEAPPPSDVSVAESQALLE
ncbi:hypothetical protein J8273_6940 [Carpediemonas membranifera]|uniref:Uncharacterized protein n=1 Tax=Carpediemonas membranifera TaxID=201153 RepID=A0A8J6DZP4_9EUKA|nr:hypothetical protein J8273_6940 [Carpediemonas membranifera]|eukprot:KAG9390701.1 hypothetical protein J8273_6940 [Carpediemonas membranifera]